MLHEIEPITSSRYTWKRFIGCLRHLRRQYEDDKIRMASNAADVDKNTFWRLLKRERGGGRNSLNAIKDRNKKVVSDPKQIMHVWKEHFSGFCDPKDDPVYDSVHYRSVTEEVSSWLDGVDGYIFTEVYFEFEKIQKGILHLNSGKAPEFDGLTKEHLINAGGGVMLHLMFRWIFDIEEIPINFRRGTQVPLYKGKNAPTPDVNSYSGITLFTTLNKLFEVILWLTMKHWWLNETPMSRLQGACRGGVSSLHTAMALQESVSALLERNRNVFVVFYDVSKAFDGVWMDGLFHQMRTLGIKGKTWRLLYKCYIDFQCRVRVDDLFSEWYPMLCRIHQGGYLSLIRYAVFINSLLVELEGSNLCRVVHGYNTTRLCRRHSFSKYIKT